MEKLFLVGPRSLFGRRSKSAPPVEELLANLSDAPKPRAKRKRSPRKPRAAAASAAAE